MWLRASLRVELPALRPVGGVHDGGRDAFIQECEDAPHVYCQHSVSSDWKAKIRKTVHTLRSNGFTPRTLIYCSNRDIQKDADELRAELRADDVALDIRDRPWF